MRSSSRLQSSKPSASSTSRRSPNLHLPGLPRFHPANYSTGSSTLASTSIYVSATSSTATSPPSNPNSPQPTAAAMQPPRPQYHARQYSDAQRPLYAHQRELMSLNQYAARSSQPTSPSANVNRSSPRSPRSPRLHPLGSPGPVTPLELEGQQQQRDGYIFAGTRLDTNQLSEEAKDQILDSFIQKETAEAAARGSTSGVSSQMPLQAQQARTYTFAGPMGVRRGDPTSHRSALSR